MAVGWMTVLKLVPWRDVIKNAPVIADGARRLWDTVGNKPPAAEGQAASGSSVVVAAGPQDTVALRALRAQLAEAETSITQLQAQMQASSQLIKALAEQNAELVQRVERIRLRSWWLVGAVTLVGAIAGLNLAVTL